MLKMGHQAGSIRTGSNSNLRNSVYKMAKTIKKNLKSEPSIFPPTVVLLIYNLIAALNDSFTEEIGDKWRRTWLWTLFHFKIVQQTKLHILVVTSHLLFPRDAVFVLKYNIIM